MAAQSISADTRRNINLLPGLVSTVAKHDESLSSIQHYMFGNGQPGLDEQIRKIQTWIDLQIERDKRRIQWWDKFQWVIIPLLVTAALGFVGQFVYFWMTLIPKLQALP